LKLPKVSGFEVLKWIRQQPAITGRHVPTPLASGARYSVTNRLDPAQNIQGGTRCMRDLIEMFNNDLRLAIGASAPAVARHRSVRR